MSCFASYDGTEIAFRTLGGGRPLVCLPGGPGRAARQFPRCEVVVQPGPGHFPWLDDPAWFTAAVDSFLG